MIIDNYHRCPRVLFCLYHLVHPVLPAPFNVLILPATTEDCLLRVGIIYTLGMFKFIDWIGVDRTWHGPHSLAIQAHHE
jgi:hypothetical protein